MPVVPGTQEAEAGDYLNLGGGGCNEPRSCHCSPAWATEWLKKEKERKKRKKKEKKYFIGKPHLVTSAYFIICALICKNI